MRDDPSLKAAFSDTVPEAWRRASETLASHPEAGRLPLWFRENLEDAEPVSLSEGILCVRVSSQLTREWLDRRYRSLLEQILSNELGSAVKLQLLTGAKQDAGRRKAAKRSSEQPANVKGESEAPAKENGWIEGGRRGLSPEALRSRLVEQLNCSPLNPRYNFSTFVPGNNRFACAAAEAVAAAPGDAYNPLFIHGGVGLGKTHLMHAIGQEILLRRPKTVVAYLSGEAFTSSFVSAIRERRMEEFRRLYRHVDVWLVDDIQFIAAKERTGEEFFHTFNSLHGINRQVVICSDRPPQELQILDERMASRFEAGLVADVVAPDNETRLAILEQKVRAEGAAIPGEVLQMMARMIRSNIRILEGALIRLLAHASFTSSPINLQMATSLLTRYFDEGTRAPVRVESVQRVVCECLEVPLEALLGKKRDKRALMARQMAMYLARELTDSSLEQIGHLFGGKDHSTVAHACRTFKQALLIDTDLDRTTTRVRDRIRRTK